MRSTIARAIPLAALVLSAACSTPTIPDPPPQLCVDVAAAEDAHALGRVVDDVAPGHDEARNEAQAESTVATSCPDQTAKLQRFRDQVIRPVAGGR